MMPIKQEIDHQDLKETRVAKTSLSNQIVFKKEQNREEAYFSATDDMANPCNGKLLHTYHLCNAYYRFFVDAESQLRAEYNQLGYKVTASTITGVPNALQHHLHDASRQYQVKTLLNRCFFSYQGGTISANPRALGGWNKDVHYHLTKFWARHILEFSDEDASYIARYCNQIDEGATDPVRHAMCAKAQGWHFNVKAGEDGCDCDSRIKHVVENLNKSIDLKACTEHETTYTYKIGNMEKSKKMKNSPRIIALIVLGQGLHPLQDIFAHTKKWVSTGGVRDSSVKFHLSPDTDEPKAINEDKHSPISLCPVDASYLYSQRFTNTRLLTFFYLNCFKNNKSMNTNELSTYVQEALKIACYTERKDGISKENVILKEKSRLQNFIINQLKIPHLEEKYFAQSGQEFQIQPMAALFGPDGDKAMVQPDRVGSDGNTTWMGIDEYNQLVTRFMDVDRDDGMDKLQLTT